MRPRDRAHGGRAGSRQSRESRARTSVRTGPMPAGWIWAFSLVAAVAPGPADSPMAWSPNGEWVAYTVKAGSAVNTLPKRWLFQPDRLRDEPAEDGQPAGAARTRLE